MLAIRSTEEGPRPRGRLLLVTPLPPPPGGATAKGLRLFEGLKRAGWDVSVVRLSRAGTLKRRGERTSLADFRAAASVLARVIARLPGVQYVLMAGSDRQLVTLAPAVLLLANSRRIPVAFHCFGGGTDLFLSSLTPRRRAGAFATIRSLDLFLPETEQLVAALRSEAEGARILQLPNFVEDPGVRAEPWRSGRLVYVGHVRREKGVYELLSAFAPVADRAELTIAGPVYPNEEAEWRAALGSCPGAVWLGSVPRERVTEELASARALVLPTRYEGEGHSGAVLEAFAVGLPVVSTRHRAIPEIVEDGVNGWLVEPGDVRALTLALQRVLDAPEDEIRRLSEGALATAARRSTERVVGRLSDAIEKRLRRRG